MIATTWHQFSRLLEAAFDVLPEADLAAWALRLRELAERCDAARRARSATITDPAARLYRPKERPWHE